MVFFAACVSVVFATLMRDAPAAQVRTAARIFAALIGGALAVGWLLFGIFR
jgi:hypothetical protein